MNKSVPPSGLVGRHLGLLGCVWLLAGTAHAQVPYLTVLTPPRNARSVAPSATVALTFSQPMNAATAAAVQLHSAQRGGVKAATYTGAGATLSVNPADDFLSGETVTVCVPASVRSAGGTAAVPHVYQFTTATGGSGRGHFVPVPATPDIPIPYGVDAMALGDLDGDGDLDVVARYSLSTPNFTTTLSVMQNSGVNSGTFVPVTTFGQGLTGSDFGNIVLGDVDGDGDLDMLAPNYIGGNSNNTIPPRNVVNVRLNDGTGTFTRHPVNADVTIPTTSHFLATGDLDGDGDLDILTTGVSSPTTPSVVNILLNQGVHSGNFAPPASNASVSVPNVGTLVVGDLDGDGDVDFVASNNSEVRLFLNNGNGSFAAPASNGAVPVSSGGGISSMALGDIDGDGDLDLLTLTFVVRNSRATGVVNVLENTGVNSGQFGRSALNWEVPTADAPRTLILGDVDGDGDLDIVAANEGYSPAATSFSVRLNDGAGRFTAPATNADPAVGGSPRWLSLGDVDGDGDLDAVTVNRLLVPVSMGGSSLSVRRNESRPLATTTARLAEDVALYPNPARTVVAVVVPAIAGATHATLALVDAVGRTVRTQSLTLSGAGTPAQVALTGLAPGLYRVRVQAGGQQLCRTLAVE